MSQTFQLGADAQQVLLSGFGVGLSWGSSLVSLSVLKICEVIELDSSQ